MVVTDHVIVACCRFMGAVLLELRRNNKEWATENCFEMWWEKLKGFSGDRVKNLCSAKRVLNRVEDLEEVRRLLI